MLGTWLHDIESFEAISQDGGTRRIVLKMAALSRAGRMGTFLDRVNEDDEMDDDTKGKLVELGSDEAFLLAAEEYLRRTQRLH